MVDHQIGYGTRVIITMVPNRGFRSGRVSKDFTLIGLLQLSMVIEISVNSENRYF